MTSQTFLQLCLVLHITGFSMMAGTVLADFSINSRLNKFIIADKRKALSILEGSSILPVLISVGALILLTTGIGMVSIFRAAVTEMSWFRVKMILVLFVLLNGALLARPDIAKMKKLLAQDTTESDGPIEALKNRLRTIYIAQLILFLTVFVLSVFRF